MKGIIHEVAEKAGVSTATVSRVFNDGVVSGDTREKVLKAALELNYSPRMTIKKENIILVVEGLYGIHLNSYDNMLLSSITTEIFKKNYTLEILTVQDMPYLMGKFPKGIISTVYNSETLDSLTKYTKCPALLVNAVIDGFTSVCSNDLSGMEQAIDYLVKMGHDRIGIMAFDNLSNHNLKMRIQGYKNALEKHKIPYSESLVRKCTSSRSVVEDTAILLKAKPTAIIGADEDLGIQLDYALNILDRKIPEDISIISFECNNVSKFLTPPHTTLAQDFHIIGTMAVELLEGMISQDKNAANRYESIPYKLIIRDSVKKISFEGI